MSKFPQGGSEVQNSEEGLDSIQQRSLKTAAIVASVVCLTWYLFVSVKMSAVEVICMTAGMTALWLPISFVVFLWTRSQFDDVLTRFTFSVISSYTLTTTLYFSFGVAGLWIPGFDRGFPVALGLIGVGGLIHIGRARSAANMRHDHHSSRIATFDWFLVLVLILSSFVTTRYKSVFEFDPKQQVYQFTNCADHTYFTSVSYECLRHTPMLQTPYRAGKASRAYHMFPHLTTALVGRFTMQPDLLRAHLVYEYTFIEWFMLLALFCSVRQITGSREAGYLAVLLMFIGAIPTTRLYDEGARSYFYFCAWPQSSSMIEPVLITSPQQYSGSLITYGIILGISSITSRVRQGLSADRIAFVVALLAATMVRVRIQTFLPLFPAILIILGYLFFRSRSKTYLAAAAASAFLAMALILEMRSAVYMPSTSNLILGLNRIGLTIYMLNSWPGSRYWAFLLMSIFPQDSTAFAWIWQLTSHAMFIALNIIGIPFLVATNFHLRALRSWKNIDPTTFLICWLVVCSYLGSIFLAANYDNWSVGGQMLLHVNWYLYPISIAGLWGLIHRIPASKFLSPGKGRFLFCLLATLALIWHGVRPPSLLEQELRRDRMMLETEQMEALKHVKESLPESAVILSQPTICRGSCAFSGIGGRRAYIEYFPSIEQKIDPGEDSEKARELRVATLWATESEDEFCRSLPNVVTHIVEFLNNPLKVAPSDCLEEHWISSNGRARILKVKKASGSETSRD